MEHKSIKTVRGTVHYWISEAAVPDARCIVFTHGLTADHTMFEKQVEFFRKKHTVITWDVPLHGASRPYADFTYMNTAKDLQAVLDQEKMDAVVLVGMSMGGYPCQMFASVCPERVSGFVALDTTPFGFDYYSKADMWCLKHAGRVFSCMPEKCIKKLIAKGNSRSEYGFNLIMKMLSPFTKSELLEQIDVAYRGFIQENRDMDFSFPVMILAGEFDTTGKVKAYCAEWAKKKGYPLHYIKNSAHFSNADNFEQVNAEIETFLQGL